MRNLITIIMIIAVISQSFMFSFSSKHRIKLGCELNRKGRNLNQFDLTISILTPGKKLPMTERLGKNSANQELPFFNSTEQLLFMRTRRARLPACMPLSLEHMWPFLCIKNRSSPRQVTGCLSTHPSTSDRNHKIFKYTP